MKTKKTWKKRVKKIVIIAVIAIGLLMLIASPLAKYFIEKYDKDITGREITVDWAYVNPLTGYVYLSGVKIYEANSDSLFITASGIGADFAMLKMFGGTWEISNLDLYDPIGKIIQDKNRNLNFNDWIERWRPKRKKKKSEPTHFNIAHINIVNGQFFYIEKNIPVNYNIKKVNIVSDGFRWYADTVGASFNFVSGVGKGKANGKFVVNTSNVDYNMAINVDKYELTFIAQYLEDMINFGTFRANFDARVKASGNFKAADHIVATGLLAINDFHLGKNAHEDYVSFKKLKFTVNKLSPRYHLYDLDSVTLDEPYAMYERYDEADNIEKMFGKKGTNVAAVNSTQGTHNLIIQIANYIETLAKNFLKSNYRVNKFAINKADFRFFDYAMGEKFAAFARPLTVTADSVSKSHKRVKAHLASGIYPYGSMALNVSINPKDSSDFEFTYTLRKVPVTMFNPYLVSLTSFPLDRGTVEFTGIWNVRDGIIKSNNNLLLVDARLGRKVKGKDNGWFPMHLVTYLARDNENVINYEIPVSGNLRDPVFHWRDVILDVLRNVFVKPPTTVYRTKLKNLEKTIEKSIELKWETGSSTMTRGQEKFSGKLNRFLEENPGTSITVSPIAYYEKEKEFLLIFLAKRNYYMALHHLKPGDLSRRDSSNIKKMSIKDTLFEMYLDKLAHAPLLFTVQAKCEYIWGKQLPGLQQRLYERRKQEFLSFIDPANRKNIKFMKIQSTIPYNGFSLYKIRYKGSIPPYLEKAVEKMNELDDDPPRNAYRRFRDEIRRKRR